MTVKPLFVFFSILFVTNFTVSSQSSLGSIKIIIFPENAIILLDGDTVSNGIHEVSSGTHLIEAWAPNKKVYSINVEVEPNKQQFIAYTLRVTEPYRDAYNLYQKENINYVLKKVGFIAVPAGLTMGVGIAGLNKVSKLKEELGYYQNEINYSINLHKSSNNTERLANINQNFATSTKNYYETLEEINKTERNTIIATTLLGALTVYGIIHSIKLKKPKFEYHDQPPSFSSLNIGLGSNYDRHVILTYNF